MIRPRFVLKLATAKRWPAALPPPVFAADNQALIRAVSLLCNIATRDGAAIGARDMTPDQARDVVRRFATQQEQS